MSTKYKMKCPKQPSDLPRVPSAALARFWKDRALTASRAVPARTARRPRVLSRVPRGLVAVHRDRVVTAVAFWSLPAVSPRFSMNRVATAAASGQSEIEQKQGNNHNSPPIPTLNHKTCLVLMFSRSQASNNTILSIQNTSYNQFPHDHPHNSYNQP